MDKEDLLMIKQHRLREANTDTVLYNFLTSKLTSWFTDQIPYNQQKCLEENKSNWIIKKKCHGFQKRTRCVLRNWPITTTDPRPHHACCVMNQKPKSTLTFPGCHKLHHRTGDWNHNIIIDCSRATHRKLEQRWSCKKHQLSDVGNESRMPQQSLFCLCKLSTTCWLKGFSQMAHSKSLSRWH